MDRAIGMLALRTSPPTSHVSSQLHLQAATTFTLNSPDSLGILHSVASNTSATNYRPLGPAPAAELIREVGLKCISFNGIPRSINCLGAFRALLPPDVQSQLETKPSRILTPENIEQRKKNGLALWTSVYDPFETKLINKLAESHPDLPVHILGSHYASILSNPEAGQERGKLADVGRLLTSLVAIATLRAQTGVGPQVLSHVFGLRKAIQQGFQEKEAESVEERRGFEWLGSEEGSEWLLKSVDEIVEKVGSSFAKL